MDPSHQGMVVNPAYENRGKKPVPPPKPGSGGNKPVPAPKPRVTAKPVPATKPRVPGNKPVIASKPAIAPKPSAQPAPALADGDNDVWEEAVDPSSGSTYYYNTVTQETQWDPPADYYSPRSTTTRAPPPSRPAPSRQQQQQQQDDYLAPRAAPYNDTEQQQPPEYSAPYPMPVSKTNAATEYADIDDGPEYSRPISIVMPNSNSTSTTTTTTTTTTPRFVDVVKVESRKTEKQRKKNNSELTFNRLWIGAGIVVFLIFVIGLAVGLSGKSSSDGSTGPKEDRFVISVTTDSHPEYSTDEELANVKDELKDWFASFADLDLNDIEEVRFAVYDGIDRVDSFRRRKRSDDSLQRTIEFVLSQHVPNFQAQQVSQSVQAKSLTDTMDIPLPGGDLLVLAIEGAIKTIELSPEQVEKLDKAKELISSLNTVGDVVDLIFADAAWEEIGDKVFEVLAFLLNPEEGLDGLLKQSVVDVSLNIDERENGARIATVTLSGNTNNPCPEDDKLCEVVRDIIGGSNSVNVTLILQAGPGNQLNIRGVLNLQSVAFEQDANGTCISDQQLTNARLSDINLFVVAAIGVPNLDSLGVRSIVETIAEGETESLKFSAGLAVTLKIDVNSYEDKGCVTQTSTDVLPFEGQIFVEASTGGFSLVGDVGMDGLWYQAFGQDFFNIVDLQLRLTIEIPPKLPPTLEMHGALALGFYCFERDPATSKVLRIEGDDRHCIEGNVSVGVQIKNLYYLAAALPEVTFGQLLKAFSQRSFIEKVDQFVPTLVQDCGFKNVEVEYAASLVPVTTLGGKVLNPGVHASGEFNFLGARTVASLDITLDEFELSAVMDPFTEYAPWFTLTSPNSDSQGPSVFISVKNRGLALPEVNVGIFGKVSILHASASASLVIENNAAEMNVAVDSFMGIPGLKASMVVNATLGSGNGLGALFGASFGIFGNVDLSSVIIPDWINTIVSELKGFIDSPIKFVSDKLNEIGKDDAKDFLTKLELPEKVESVEEFEAFNAKQADALKNEMEDTNVLGMKLTAGFGFQTGGGDGTTITLNCLAKVGSKEAKFDFSLNIANGWSFNQFIDELVEKALSFFLDLDKYKIIDTVHQIFTEVTNFWNKIKNAEKGLIYLRHCGCADSRATNVLGVCTDTYGKANPFENCRSGYTNIGFLCSLANTDTACDPPVDGYSCGPKGPFENHCALKL